MCLLLEGFMIPSQRFCQPVRFAFDLEDLDGFV